MSSGPLARSRATSNASVPSLRRSSISTAISQVPTSPQPICAKPVPTKEMQSSSGVWKSNNFRLQEDWKRVGQRIKRMYYENSPVPRTFGEYVDQRVAKKEWEVNVMRRQLAKLENSSTEQNKCNTPLDSQKFAGRGAVLALPTVFSKPPDDPGCRYGGSVWPSLEEYRHEGDERVATGYGRYFPIVRDWKKDNLSQPWDKVCALRPFDLDRERRIPISDSAVVQPEQAIEDEVIPSLLNSDLVEALGKIDWDILA